MSQNTAVAPKGVTLAAHNDFVPLGGLGLALSGGFDMSELRRALQRFETPAEPCGLDFSIPADCGHISGLEDTVRRFLRGRLPGAPDPTLPAFHGVVNGGPFGSAIPMFMLPGFDPLLIFYEHMVPYLDGIARGAIDRVSLHRPRAWNVEAKKSRPYRIPRAQGPVSPEHIEAFADLFPGLAEELIARVLWVAEGGRRSAPANIANATISKGLGIPVDVRSGKLVTEGCQRMATSLAAGDVVHDDGRTQHDRLWAYLEATLARVAEGSTSLRADGVVGAAWSCTVDTILNQREAWASSRWADSNTIEWASDKYLPQTHQTGVSSPVWTHSFLD